MLVKQVRNRTVEPTDRDRRFIGTAGNGLDPVYILRLVVIALKG